MEWTAVWNALKYFNYGEKLITIIKTLYTDTSSIVQNGGFTSNQFRTTRGLKQGDSLSCYLFILVVVVLGMMLRSQDLATIRMRDIKKLLGQYADDIWVVIKYEQLMLDRVLATFERFKECTGLAVNYDKTEIMRIGSTANTDAMLYTQKNIKWSSRPVKILGVKIYNDLDSSKNVTEMVEKIGNIFTMWENRELSLLGRILVCNTLSVELSSNNCNRLQLKHFK